MNHPDHDTDPRPLINGAAYRRQLIASGRLTPAALVPAPAPTAPTLRLSGPPTVPVDLERLNREAA